MWTDAAVTSALALGCAVAAATQRSYAASVGLAVLEARLGLLAHEAAHRSHPVQRLFDFAMGSFEQWKHTHQRGHHVHTNTAHDPDLQFGALMRVHPTQPWRWYHRHQWWYQWLLFPWVALALRVSGLVHLYCREPWTTVVVQHLCALPAFAIDVVYPAWRWGVVGLSHYALTCVVLGWVYGALFSVSHVNDRVHWDDDSGTSHVDHQLRATADWRPGCAWTNWATVGLNHQAVHHVYPRRSYTTYLQLQRELRCRPAYRSFPTFRAALRSNARHLHRMGEGEKKGQE